VTNLGSGVLLANSAMGGGKSVALSGIGGSGKSTTAAVAAHRVAVNERILPIFASVGTTSTDVLRIIQSRLHAIRFEADSDLVQRWSNDGRIFLVIDGIESLSTDSRHSLLVSVAKWAEEFPRCGVVVCGRAFAGDELAQFEHLQAAPLDDRQLADLAASLGLPIHPHQFAKQIRDVARWPMWATALIVHGPQVQTGLELLQLMVETRFRATNTSSPIEKERLLSLVRLIAYELWPMTETTIATALDLVETWASDAQTASRFIRRPAEAEIEKLAEIGLIELGDVVGFPHRLFATILAAEHAVADIARSQSVDEELVPFVAALADDESHADLVTSVLGGQSIYILTRYLRLSTSLERMVAMDSDIQRLIKAVRLLSLNQVDLNIATGDQWIAWHASDKFSVRHFEKDDEFREWEQASSFPIMFWPHSPFIDRTPEYIAAVFALNQFKLHALSLYPDGNPSFEYSDTELQKAMRNRKSLTAKLLATAYSRRDIYRGFVEELGSSNQFDLSSLDGEPKIDIRKNNLSEYWIEILWTDQPASVKYGELTDDWRPENAMYLREFLQDSPEANIYQTFERRVEGLLGCRLASQSWESLELVSAWSW